MQRSRRLVLPAVLLVALAACSGPPPGAAATVNGDEIDAERLESRVVATVDAAGAAVDDLSTEDRASQVSEVQRSVLTDLIYLELIDQRAEEAGVTATGAEIDELYQQQVEQAGGEEQLVTQLEANGLSRQALRRQLEASVKFTKLQEESAGDTEVTDEDVRQAFEQQQATQEPAEVAHILVETQEEAQEVIASLDEGASFADLATERSLDTQSAQQGGSLGVVDLNQLVEPFAEAVRGAEIGEIVGPVETQFGFHVIRVDDRPEVTFEEAAPEIRAQLEASQQQQVTGELLQEIVGEADVTIDSRFGVWDPQQGAVVAEDAVGEGQPAPPPGADLGTGQG